MVAVPFVLVEEAPTRRWGQRIETVAENAARRLAVSTERTDNLRYHTSDQNSSRKPSFIEVQKESLQLASWSNDNNQILRPHLSTTTMTTPPY
jgi:hypothetical protein